MGAALLTGATGFVGKEILDRFLDRGRRVYALVRAENDTAAEARLAPHANLTPVAGDIEKPGLGLASPPEDVSTILHCAASVSFDLSLDESRRVNVDGTRNVLDLAKRCDRLERLSYVSTAYVAGEPRRLFQENELDVGQRFRNPYERSKFEAERMLREHADGLPLQVLRPSIVVGDSRTGRTSSFNVLYGPLKALAGGRRAGRLRGRPGGRPRRAWLRRDLPPGRGPQRDDGRAAARPGVGEARAPAAGRAAAHGLPPPPAPVAAAQVQRPAADGGLLPLLHDAGALRRHPVRARSAGGGDRKSTRLNSSH